MNARAASLVVALGLAVLGRAAGEALAGDPPPAAPPAAKAPATPAAAVPAALEEAGKRLLAGKFQEAIDAAGTIAADDPAYAKARYLMAEAALMRGEAALAQGWFEAALEKKPGAEPALTGLGRALLAQEKAEEAVAALEKAVAADSKSARARAALGLAKAKAGKPEAGRKDLEAASKLDPQDVEVARMAVEERLVAADTAGAAKAAAALSKARKDHPMAAFLSALVADRAGKFEDAIAGYEKAISLDAAFLDAHKNLAILCIAQNPLYQDPVRTKKAMEHFKRYQELGGRDEKVLSVYETLRQFVSEEKASK